jgi:hypothetical protein
VLPFDQAHFLTIESVQLIESDPLLSVLACDKHFSEEKELDKSCFGGKWDGEERLIRLGVGDKEGIKEFDGNPYIFFSRALKIKRNIDIKRR